MSRDAGDTWLPIELPEPYLAGSAIRVSRGGRFLYFGTAVYASETGIDGWSPVRDRGRGGLPGLVLDDGRFVESGGVLANTEFLHISTDPDTW